MNFKIYNKGFFLVILLFSLENCVSFATTENPGGESGLVSNYFRDRVMDFRDIFSVNCSGWSGWGAKSPSRTDWSRTLFRARCFGHGDFTDEYGLKNGEFAKQNTEEIVLLLGLKFKLG